MNTKEYAQDNGGKRAYASKDHYGLTKRELFAAMTMQGIVSAEPPVSEDEKNLLLPSLAKLAVDVADALLLALEEK